MSVAYHCPHLATPHPPFPPSYPSSSSSLSPLSHLYFCEECDAIRCNQCVAQEVASYFCPNCLFDVPSANVRADKNRCARSCFSCPRCPTALQVVSAETLDPSSSQMMVGPPYLLSCSSCKWSSKEIGWEFEKNTSIALQVQKLLSSSETKQAEFDAIKDHLDSYLTLSTPQPAAQIPRSGLSARQPTRHISHLTQMAAKALHRDVPGMRSVRKKADDGKEKVGLAWDDIGEYSVKGSWKETGLERGMGAVEELRTARRLEAAALERRSEASWERSRNTRDMTPERIPLLTKMTKRCPHSGCRHLLIQPDTKSVRFKIKMVASNYIPTLEVGRRRRRLLSGDSDQPMTPEEIERRRRERRRTRAREEEDEFMDEELNPGGVYTFQIAFTNPLYDPIQIRLSQPHPPRDAPLVNHHLHIPTQHFTVAAFKDAWAYDEDEEEDETMPSQEGSEGVSEDGSNFNTLGRRSRKSLLGTSSLREKKRSEAGVEKKGNISKVGIEVEVLPDATGPVEFDLEVRYTYRAEEGAVEKDGEEGKEKERKGKDEYKTFTFWTRVKVGEVRN